MTIATNNAANNSGFTNPRNLLLATTNLTSDDIKNLTTVFPSLISAPGANLMILPQYLGIMLFFNTTQYSGAGTLQVKWTTGTAIISGTMNGTVTIGGAASSFYMIELKSNSNLALTNYTNIGVSLKNTATAFTLGDSTARAFLWYSIVSTA